MVVEEVIFDEITFKLIVESLMEVNHEDTEGAALWAEETASTEALTTEGVWFSEAQEESMMAVEGAEQHRAGDDKVNAGWQATSGGVS